MQFPGVPEVSRAQWMVRGAYQRSVGRTRGLLGVPEVCWAFQRSVGHTGALWGVPEVCGAHFQEFPQATVVDPLVVRNGGPPSAELSPYALLFSHVPASDAGEGQCPKDHFKRLQRYLQCTYHGKVIADGEEPQP